MRNLFLKVVFIVLIKSTAAGQNAVLNTNTTKPVLAIESSSEVSLLFIGDFMGHLDQINAAYNKSLGVYNYNPTFNKIAPILNDADVTIGNLEVTLGVRPYSGYPRFSSPASYASAIKQSGVDVLVTANNHSCDKNKKGLERTIAVLDSLNIGHTGTFVSEKSKLVSPAYVIEKKQH